MTGAPFNCGGRASTIDPARALVAAADVLRAKSPQRQAFLYIDGWRLLARFDFPGVVSVFFDDNGAQIAQSRPGEPYVLAAAQRRGE